MSRKEIEVHRGCFTFFARDPVRYVCGMPSANRSRSSEPSHHALIRKVSLLVEYQQIRCELVDFGEQLREGSGFERGGYYTFPIPQVWFGESKLHVRLSEFAREWFGCIPHDVHYEERLRFLA